jgi:hypothetical protein
MDGYCGYYDDLNTGVEIDLLLSLRGSLLVWGGCSVGVLAEGVIASSSCSASLFERVIFNPARRSSKVQRFIDVSLFDVARDQGCGSRRNDTDPDV